MDFTGVVWDRVVSGDRRVVMSGTRSCEFRLAACATARSTKLSRPVDGDGFNVPRVGVDCWGKSSLICSGGTGFSGAGGVSSGAFGFSLSCLGKSILSYGSPRRRSRKLGGDRRSNFSSAG